MTISKKIADSFIKEKLSGNIVLLIDFNLGHLRYDNDYGCPRRKFDPHDTNLMRAIYCIVFGDVWKNLSWENSGDGRLRGDTLNSSATFFSYPWDDKFAPKCNPPIELADKIRKFQHTFHIRMEYGWEIIDRCFFSYRQESCTPDAVQFELKAGDRILLCTDGLYKSMVPGILLENVLDEKSPDEILDAFRIHCERQGDDNYTAVLIAVE